MVEKKHRIEDALEAVQSAQQEGIVPGGGTALLNATRNLKVEVENPNQQIGVDILIKAVEAPIRQMAANAGISPDIVCEQVQSKLKKGPYGYNFVTGKVQNMMEAGVIDPVKVTRTALQNAASVAGTLITTNYSVIQQ